MMTADIGGINSELSYYMITADNNNIYLKTHENLKIFITKQWQIQESPCTKHVVDHK